MGICLCVSDSLTYTVYDHLIGNQPVYFGSKFCKDLQLVVSMIIRSIRPDGHHWGARWVPHPTISGCYSPNAPVSHQRREAGQASSRHTSEWLGGQFLIDQRNLELPRLYSKYGSPY